MYARRGPRDRGAGAVRGPEKHREHGRATHGYLLIPHGKNVLGPTRPSLRVVRSLPPGFPRGPGGLDLVFLLPRRAAGTPSLGAPNQEGRSGSDEVVPGTSVFPSGEPGVSGDFWDARLAKGSQEPRPCLWNFYLLSTSDRSTRLNSSHSGQSRMPSSA